jgi:hypothetical protein
MKTIISLATAAVGIGLFGVCGVSAGPADGVVNRPGFVGGHLV